MRATLDGFGIRGAAAMAVVSVLVGCGPTIRTGVANAQLTVADAQLTMRVKTALLNDLELGTQPIDVEVNGGIVFLSGHVESTDDIAHAERLVRAVDGVRDVDVALEVGPGEFIGRAHPGRLPSIAPPNTNEPRRLLALGVGGTLSSASGDDLGSGLGVDLIIRLRPRNGWGPSLGLGWTRAPMVGTLAGRRGLADLVVRPVMGGVEYGVTRGRLATAFSLVGGYSFNSLAIDEGQFGPGRAIAVDNSLVFRSGVGVWYDVTSRVGLNVFAGYRVTRPRVTFASDSDITTRRLNADTALLTVGVAYWVF